MKYTRAQILMSFAIGALIAWQGVPSEIKKSLPYLWVWEISASVLLGGLYAVEKLTARGHGESNQEDKKDGG